MSKNDGNRKARKAVIEKYLGGLFGRTEGYARNVSRYYTAAVEALLDLAATADLKPDEVFHFSDHKRMSVKATNILRGLYSAVYQEIRRGVRAEWEFANLSADALITSLFGKGVQEDNHFARWFARNQEALDSFFSRKDAHGGLNLSQKVWKYTGQLKEEMELALSVSLGRGDSASTVSRHVRQYLREPDRLFRRVRDAQGNLKLSKRAAAYHPGRGEYRSSYKNAMRLTRTETNMAYRAADCDRWSRIPFVVGMEVKRSNHPFGCEVCEALKGKYPKDFVFTGWHPQCRCYIVPVLASEEERMAYHRAILNGEDVSDFHFSGEVREVPDGMKKWMGENQERIAKAKSLPYWMKDNGRYVGGAAVVQQHTGHEAVKSETHSHKGQGSQLGHKPTKHGEQFLPIPMKPANLEEIQIINNRNRIAKLSGFTDDEISKMRPMVFDDANSGNVNAQIARNVDTRTNCQGCVVTFEARCRGIDVTATGYDNEEFRLLLEKDQTLAWRNKKGEHPKLTAEFTNEEAALAFLNGSEMAKNGRYQLGINKWKYDEDGHILNLIRADGVTYIYDGQLKYRCELSDIFAGVDWSGKVELLRVDKLLFDERCVQLFKRR